MLPAPREMHDRSKGLQDSVIVLAVEVGVRHTDGAGEKLFSKRLHDNNASCDEPAFENGGQTS